jgi:hypothetical protein
MSLLFACLTCVFVAQQLPIASTNFYEVVFDLLKIVCASVHALFAKFWAKNVCWHAKESVKIVAIHLCLWIESTCNIVWLYKCCIWNWSPFRPLLVVLSVLVRTKNCWIGMHMSGKRPFMAGVGLNLQGVLTREIYGSSTRHTLPVLVLLWILPPSQSSCPTSSLNRENSGIAPKRHTIRNQLHEHYRSMYMIISGRIHLNVHNCTFTLSKLSTWSIYAITRNDGPSRLQTPNPR